MTKPVLVVGAGPVGLTMAAELARYRIPVRIIDKAPARSDTSKALAVWSRTLELLDRAGCAETFVATGLETEAVDIISGKEVIARVTFDGIQSPFSSLLMLPQAETERLLEQHLAAFGVTVERNVELTGFIDRGDDVTADVRRSDGASERIEADWLIGCDGAHSVVRHELGFDFVGETLAANFILADVHVAGLEVAETDLALFWHREGLLVFFPIAKGHYRVMSDVGAAPHPHPTLEDVQAIVDRRGPGSVKLHDPTWLAGFGVNERTVERYRAGRVFLAGDAAHIHSPAGGQGMNTGMQDAFNLAWKLALVSQDSADESLLDSYSSERSGVAEQVLRDSGRLVRVGVAQGAIAQSLRNFVVHRILGLSSVRRAAAERLSEISVGYPDSAINVGSATGLEGPAPGRRIMADAPFGAGDRRVSRCSPPTSTPREPCFAVMRDCSNRASANRPTPTESGSSVRTAMWRRRRMPGNGGRSKIACNASRDPAATGSGRRAAPDRPGSGRDGRRAIREAC
jgi:2-polyprenyl-6-methoxyphenol hydroxylase-like FAD-dependent oxidoreductase